MIKHLSSEHYLEIEHDKLKWLVCVTECNGDYVVGRVYCHDRDQWRQYNVNGKLKVRHEVARLAMKYFDE